MRWGIPASTSPPTALPISPPFGSSSTGKTEFASQASGGDPPRTSSRCRLGISTATRSEEHTSELQSQSNLVCRLLLEKKKRPTLIDDDDHRLVATDTRSSERSCARPALPVTAT